MNDDDLLARLPPEERARVIIDRLLAASGWAVQGAGQVNLSASRGVAIREFILEPPHGRVDYLLYVDGKAAGTIEAKPEGYTLTSVEPQTAQYIGGMPSGFPAWDNPLPFSYESTGTETRFTSWLDPDPRSRLVFTFHRPETLASWLDDWQRTPDRATLRSRLQQMPPLEMGLLWPPKDIAITNLEHSLADNRPRALIQMATGSGKTLLAAFAAYRLVKFADARRVLFLVDRANLGRQTMREFQGFTTPDDGRKFTELYNVQRLSSNVIDPVSRVTITTIQRLYSIMRGDEDLDEEVDEHSVYELSGPVAAPVVYNPALPIEFFDFIIVDECHRSIFGLWRQVLDYFDAFIIGLTATPNKQAFGFFHKNLVMEYTHEQAVADHVNVGFDVYRIKTEITEQGSTVDAGVYVGHRDRSSRHVRWEEADEELAYAPGELDRAVVAPDQIRTVIRTFKERLFTEIFPGRTEVPKTLIFAKDDSHAEDIVDIVREEFGKGNEFAAKITYRTTGKKPEDLLAEFRNSYFPRIAVTVDMIATGTDVKPLECVFFMRSVKSRTYFEQMKGRGVRVINPTDLQQVTPDAAIKDHFVIVDAVGVTETELMETKPLDRKPGVALSKLFNDLAFGRRDPDLVSAIADRLARLDLRLTGTDRLTIEELTDGMSLQQITGALLAALDPDRQLDEARSITGADDPAQSDVTEAARVLIDAAAFPLASNPLLRTTIVELRRSYEQLIDDTSTDQVVFAGHLTEQARRTVDDFRQFIEDHKDEITALQILYSHPYQRRVTFRDIRELANAIGRPPHQWTPEGLWTAYRALDESTVHGSGQRTLTDLVSLVRYALGEDGELIPYPQKVNDRFTAWLAQQKQAGAKFSDEQLHWLEEIRDHVAASMGITSDDLDYTPFVERGGIGKAWELFGDRLNPLLDELTEVLAA
ncbi:MAG: type I restriction-modification enzyme R subunit C-terminal domain-containing protein [Acidimicrobiales bacterium]